MDSPDRAERATTRYAVQVGAFESEERARSLVAAVNASGFRARMVRVTGSALVHVRIGTFLDRTGAAELMVRVRRRGHEATIAVDVAEEGADAVSVPPRVQKTAWHVVLAEDDDDYAIVIERALENVADVPMEIREGSHRYRSAHPAQG